MLTQHQQRHSDRSYKVQPHIIAPPWVLANSWRILGRGGSLLTLKQWQCEGDSFTTHLHSCRVIWGSIPELAAADLSGYALPGKMHGDVGCF